MKNKALTLLGLVVLGLVTLAGPAYVVYLWLGTQEPKTVRVMATAAICAWPLPMIVGLAVAQGWVRNALGYFEQGVDAAVSAGTQVAGLRVQTTSALREVRQSKPPPAQAAFNVYLPGGRPAFPQQPVITRRALGAGDEVVEM